MQHILRYRLCCFVAWVCFSRILHILRCWLSTFKSQKYIGLKATYALVVVSDTSLHQVLSLRYSKALVNGSKCHMYTQGHACMQPYMVSIADNPYMYIFVFLECPIAPETGLHICLASDTGLQYNVGLERRIASEARLKHLPWACLAGWVAQKVAQKGGMCDQGFRAPLSSMAFHAIWSLDFVTF